MGNILFSESDASGRRLDIEISIFLLVTLRLGVGPHIGIEMSGFVRSIEWFCGDLNGRNRSLINAEARQ
jgi:hypothetical protein